MTAIGDVIQPGQPIPDDVTAFISSGGERATRADHATDTGNPWLSAACQPQCVGHAADEFVHPLTVTAVREPAPAQEVGMIADDCSWCKAHGYTLGQQLTHEGVPVAAASLVLSLPEVPEGTVALIDRHKRRWTLSAATDLAADSGGRLPLWESGSGALRTYFALLAGSGPLTVEMAPPREPRTWPKLDGAPGDLKAFKGASGMVYRPKREGSEYFVAEADRSPTPAAKRLSTWQELDGPLTEVFDNEPGGAA